MDRSLAEMYKSDVQEKIEDLENERLELESMLEGEDRDKHPVYDMIAHWNYTLKTINETLSNL